MCCSNTDSEENIYPNCRCRDITKPVCFYCEDTEIEEEEERDEKVNSDSNIAND